MQNIKIYQEAIGSLKYLATNTRPDIAHSVHTLARKLLAPTEEDWTNTKHIFRYLQQTKNYKIVYNKAISPEIVAYADATWAETKERKSVGGHCSICVEEP